METAKRPELLAPAGDLEKLMVAAEYGADAVYIGGSALSLRAKAKNFDGENMYKGIEYAHARGVKVYVAVNVFARNDDFKDLENYLKELESYGADALIISDLGIFHTAVNTISIPIHISTQANCTNLYSALAWQKLGASRIVLARELNLREISEIKSRIESAGEDLELEVFVHGAMCMSYSGRCLLSGYLAGRDANRGECAHPCRWKYHIFEENRPGEFIPLVEEKGGTFIFNSRDLCMIEHIPELIGAGVGSLKIEGRMKTPYYVAATTKAYRQALDDYYKSPELYESNKHEYLSELEKVSHRAFFTGFYFYDKNKTSNWNAQIYESSSYIRKYEFVGIIRDYDAVAKMALVEQRNKFSVGDEVEFLRAGGENFTQTVEHIFDEDGIPIDSAPHAQQIIKIPVDQPVAKFDIMRIEDRN